ncbi:MAG: anti-sigma factor antagonist [Planctomycetota bacterium]|nr:MAG: anti-sigma factor antagonist [Planctomycetota bacterium]
MFAVGIPHPLTFHRLPMPIHAFPVVLPYQPYSDGREDLPTLSIQAVASTARNALAVANAFVPLSCQRRYGCPPRHVHFERARMGAAGPTISDPYAYVLSHTNNIGIIPFPRRLDRQSSEALRNRITGIIAGGGDTIIVDAALLSFLDSAAITSLGVIAGLASDAKRINLHFFRPSSPIRKVFEIVGLHKVLGIHDSLVQALKAATPDRPLAAQQ